MEVMTAEQAAEAARGLTFEKVWAALMESRERQEKASAEMREARERQERASAEAREWQDRIFAKIEETSAKTFAEVRASFAESKALVDRVSKQVGELSDSVGRVIEEMFAAKLWEKFVGIYKFIPGDLQRVRDKSGNIIAQIDMFLEGDDCAMAVEIKTTLRKDDVDDHLERLEIVRQYMNERNDKRTLVGAVAGAVVHHSVCTYAHRHGLYVLEQSGESVVLLESPHGFTAAEW